MTKELGTVYRVMDNIGRVIVGKQDAVKLTMIALLCRGHVLIEDVPGVGKTSLVLALVRSLDASGRRIQFTPDTMPSDITGYSVFNQKTQEFEFRPGASMCNILLADEINRTSPRTQAALLEVMEERQVTVDGQTFALPSPFMVLATQNPIEHVGTYPLPEAQLDRFFLRVNMGYPTPAEEQVMLDRFTDDSPLEALEAVADAQELTAASRAVLEVFVDPDVARYIITLVGLTRTHPLLMLGGSPRASLALRNAARACAFLAGRDFVLPDDVKAMAIPVLAHRVLLSQEGRLKRLQTQDIIRTIVDSAEVPVMKHV